MDTRSVSFDGMPSGAGTQEQMESGSVPGRIEVIGRIEIAERELDEAKRALDSLLRTMKVASRTETTPVTRAVTDAFDRIRVAQVNLRELRELLGAPAQ